ncbi:MAG: hypothetical protein ACYDHU_02110 [Acidimicrobiales bacterium]
MNVKNRKSVPVVAVLMSLAVVGTACGTASSTTSHPSARVNHTSTTVAAQPNAAELKNELLTSSSLPANLSVTTQPGAFGIKCLANAMAVAASAVHATVVFVHNPTTATLTATVFVESLAYFPKGATGAMATITRGLNACGTTNFTSGSSSSLKGSINALSFPLIANQSNAWHGTFTGTSGGTSGGLNVYVVAFRKDRSVGMVTYTTSSTPSVTAVENYARSAAARVTS